MDHQMKINRAINKMSNIEQLEARDVMEWQDKDDQDKTWVYCQSYFKKLWTQKTCYGRGSPRKHGFAESAANISYGLTETSAERLSVNLCEISVASTEDKEHIQKMSNTTGELMPIVKNQQIQINELIK